jgi:regulator of protease activity HflC (stomatin/prohibitin superfamily)
MGAFDWLSQFIETLSKLFPRLKHILATEEAVCFKRGTARKLGPGMHWYWPVWSTISEYPVKRQSLNLHPQTLMTKDAETVVAAVTVVYQISDILKALVDTFDLNDTIGDMAQWGVKRIITSMSFDEIRDEKTTVDRRLTFAIRSALHPFGIQVIRSFLFDFSTATVLRNITDNRKSD